MLNYYIIAMILTGETCEGFGELSRVVSKTSQVFGNRACHDYYGRVPEAP